MLCFSMCQICITRINGTVALPSSYFVMIFHEVIDLLCLFPLLSLESTHQQEIYRDQTSPNNIIKGSASETVRSTERRKFDNSLVTYKSKLYIVDSPGFPRFHPLYRQIGCHPMEYPKFCLPLLRLTSLQTARADSRSSVAKHEC